ncbi:vWA domain-containing protein [Embleya sp. MST-111070]|uniref:vWA domain-containing protein n=1 Tax=Embleya sp. MST-111070 TaxID=3398231 RepID=UPI003F732132
MNSALRHILIVLDRSGSMHSVRTDTEGGLAAFLAEQQAAPTRDIVTFVRFNEQVETVFPCVPLDAVPVLTLRPDGRTALLDAVGMTITGEMARVETLTKEERPDETVVVILTDGAENASREYDLPTVNDLITRQQADAGWRFVFLGADQDAFAAATGMGIGGDTTLSYDSRVSTNSIKAAGTMISRGGDTGSYVFTDDERDTANGDTAH